jgi:hypothetical protein
MTSERARFWAKVRKGEHADHCWEWTASKRAKGYGAFVWHDRNGRVVNGRAHRYAWMVTNGEIPEGLCVLHKCDNPTCVRPDHLFIGTRADNNRDMHRKRRAVAGGTLCGTGVYPRGSSHHGAKLTEQDIRRLRMLVGTRSYSQLARQFNITASHVHRIVKRKVWKHVG